jgi:sigma-B regulation protein RsbU (phosphoserine phosphatase)
MIFHPRSLQQRTLFFILAPTLLLLVTLSVGGFVFVRSILLDQWGETAVVKLQRTAHLIDMELRRPKELLSLLQSSDDTDVNRQISTHILGQIEELEGVVGVNVEWPESDFSRKKMSGMAMNPAMEMMPQYRLERFEVGSPRYDSKLNNRTVSLISEFINRDDSIVGRVEVIISFDTLIEQILNAPWWKSNKAYLIDSSGNVLISTALQLELEDYFPMRAFGTVNALEKETLAAMGNNKSGTVFGPGSPPEEISGFYHLKEAPWTMVIMAPGEKVLQPIIQFKLFYIFTFTICIVLILFFIRQATNRVTARIKAVSAAADDLAQGKFGPPLSIITRDEVSELAQSFNKMSGQLKHRLEMKEAINIAREVQQNLLPSDSFLAEGIEAAGMSLYCDETGGDYFDIIKFSGNDRKVSVVVGDVVGHGIGAALLMATVRALLRCRVFLPGQLDEVISDVNRLLWRDTSISGNFVTLFYLEVDRVQNTMRWVRGGHDPAMVYSPASREFSELKGNGVALGVDAKWSFEYNELPVSDEEQLTFIGSDGAWEVENATGEHFGKERLRQILAATSDLKPAEILQTIIEEIHEFRGETPQNDDITMVVVKTW